MDTSRLTAHQIQMYNDKLRYQQNKQTKEQFEQDLRDSVKKTTPSNTGLFGATNIFETPLVKDSANLISLNKRKHIMKEKMIDMITDLNEKDFDRFESTMMTYQLTK